VSIPPRVEPSLLGRMNERQVLRTLQLHGPLSRAEVARRTGLSAPTVSKAAASLLRTGMLEEHETPECNRGRPAKRLRLACVTAQVVGVVIDAETCQVIPASLDGQLQAEREVTIPTPSTYAKLLDAIAAAVRSLVALPDVATLGVGISLPGLIDYRQQRGVFSPNVPQTDGHAPALDLQERLGLDCVMLQECHALCLAERHYGLARGLDDFAMLEVGTGVGLGVVSGGALVTGHNGLAGEIGHVTVVENGRPCGCGNRGCLETVASDSSLAWRVSRRLGRRVNVEQVVELARSGKMDLSEELGDTCRYLALGLAAVINLFNPATLFVHGRQFDADPGIFPRLVEITRRRTLPPSYAACRIVQARGSKKQGAAAAIIQQLTSAIAPAFAAPVPYSTRALAER
jgi:predicted NBD/HSP70 family sugar kinase